MKKMLFTGASGFLGNHIKPLLREQYDITTLGITEQDDLRVNLAKEIPSLPAGFDLVLHAAGKAHVVPKTAAEIQSFYDVNLTGTKNLCAALEASESLPKALIFLSTVAVYGCDTGTLIDERHPLEGTSPYADSKIQAERFLQTWCEEHGVLLGILRPALIAGPNAIGNLGAMVNGIQRGRYCSVAGGRARKSMLMVQDIANLIPLVEAKGGIYNICDSHHPSFAELEAVIAQQLGKRRPLNIPYWLAKSMALVGDCLGKKAPINSYRLAKITEAMTFSNQKAVKELGWTPLDVLENYHIE